MDEISRWYALYVNGKLTSIKECNMGIPTPVYFGIIDYHMESEKEKTKYLVRECPFCDFGLNRSDVQALVIPTAME